VQGGGNVEGRCVGEGFGFVCCEGDFCWESALPYFLAKEETYVVVVGVVNLRHEHQNGDLQSHYC
jgi:hypothetical protein